MNELVDLARDLRTNVEVKDRKYRLKTYPKCFVGCDAVAWLVAAEKAADEDQAVALGNILMDAGLLHHVVRDHRFKNEGLYYRFAEDEDHGRVVVDGSGEAVSWLELVDRESPLRDDSASSDAPAPDNRLPRIPSYEDELAEMVGAPALGVEPMDKYNAELLDSVHPRAWRNPTPKGRYNMVVIGAGTGGLVTAAACAGLGGRIALIESHLLGGDCLNVGCVPSKALLRSAKAVAQVRTAGRYGVHIAGDIEVDFGAVMERLRRLRAQISHHDSAERFANLGVDVFIGQAQFTGRDSVSVAGETLRFAKAVIATGGSPAIPPVPGLRESPYYTNANIFSLERLPPRILVIGAGVIGVEVAQAFARFGSQVTVLQRSQRILPREDVDAAACVRASLEADGVRFLFDTQLDKVESTAPRGQADWPVHTAYTNHGELQAELIFVATGRRPNVEGLGLEDAGVEFDVRKGVIVDDRLRTSNTDVYAVGDVCTRYQFTHAADFMARIAVRNALFFGRDRFSKLLIPWCTYTQPEVAHVGLYESDLEEREIAFTTMTRPFAEVDRAIVDESTGGFVRLHLKKGSDEILGATIVGEHAGDMISEVTVAMRAKLGLGALAGVIHPYPTAAEAIRQLGDAYNRTRLTKTVKSLFRGLLALRR